MSQDGYRRNVGIILINDHSQVLIANRSNQLSAWQFPQGGIDDHEIPEQAMFRELKEELGLSREDVTILARSKRWVSYAIPPEFQRALGKPACCGQHQKWFALQKGKSESSGSAHQLRHSCNYRI